MSNNFGAILKNIRKEKGLTTERLSQMLGGISQASLNKLENGKMKRIEPDMVYKLCQTLNISANQLFVMESENSWASKCNDNTEYKAKKLEEVLKHVTEELKKFELQDKTFLKIVDTIDYFKLDTNKVDGRIQIFCEEGLIPIGGRFKEDEMLYAMVLMSFWGKLYFKYKKLTMKMRKEEHCMAIENLLLYLGRELRQQSMYDIKPYKKFLTEQFYKEFKELIETSVNSLDEEIQHFTQSHNSQETDEFKNVKVIYETIAFKGKEIEYYDYITKKYRNVYIYNTVEIQYMAMNLYTRVFAESVLWLNKEKQFEHSCSIMLWQNLDKMRSIIWKYFIY